MVFKLIHVGLFKLQVEKETFLLQKWTEGLHF